MGNRAVQEKAVTVIPPWRDRLRMNRFVVLGRVGMDLYADPPGTRIEQALAFTTAIGGSAGNIAVALARQGCHAALLTCVSDDAVGRFCVAQLAGYGVDVTHVRAVPDTRNSLAVVETRPDAQTVLYRNGAADFALTDVDMDFDGIGALIVTGTALAMDPSRGATFGAMAQARAAGAVVVLDVDYRPYSWANDAADICKQAAGLADIVIGNDVEFGLLAGGVDKGLAFARAHVGAFNVYKMGEHGCVTITQDSAFETPIYPVQARKPMGAGDGFMGGLMAGLAHGDTLPDAVARGAATAAIIVAGVGCAPASPHTAMLETFMAGNTHAHRPL
jgi:5-dehydro-2-deoxygluconokinase